MRRNKTERTDRRRCGRQVGGDKEKIGRNKIGTTKVREERRGRNKEKIQKEEE